MLMTARSLVGAGHARNHNCLNLQLSFVGNLIFDVVLSRHDGFLQLGLYVMEEGNHLRL